MKLTDPNWIGLGWLWSRLDWTGLARLAELAKLAGLLWTELDLPGTRVELVLSRLDWTRVSWLELDLVGLVWSRLD